MSKIKLFHDSYSGITWACRIVETGDSYGRDGCLINQNSPMVEFYDTRYEFDDLGQFVSRYYVDTLTKSHNGKLCLDEAIKAWTIYDDCFGRIKTWLQTLVQEELK